MNETTCTGLEQEEFFQDFYHLSYIGTDTLEKVEPHTHGFYEMIFYINGEIEFTIDQASYAPVFGDVILMAPSTVHEASIKKGSEPYRRYVLWITKEFVQALIDYDPSMTNLFHGVNTSSFHQFRFEQKKMNQIIHILAEISECQYLKEFSYLTKCKYLLHNLFHELNFTLYQDAYYNSNLQNRDVHLEITDYIKENLRGDLSLDKLAEEFYMSKYHMLHIFKDKMSISIHKYIVIRRLEYGKSLILSGETISKVHTLCGFKDYATFYRAFVKRNGMSPKEYYKTHKQNAIY